MPLQNGTILNNRYRILSVLGQGGFGAVYRAADMTLKRPCAVKENLDTSPEARRQFEKEAIVLAQLSHPNLPRVQDHFIIPQQGQYLVMDFVDGQDLQTIVSQGGRVDPETALDWIGQIASALAYLHEQKPPIIHRDIKPANIRVTEEGKAFLVDFGLVKIYDPHLRTTLGARAVTPGYSPPEQYGQGNTDVRTDIYALGATLYHLLTGLEPPESVQRVIEDQLIPLGAANPRVQAAMSTAVSKAMDLRPSGRYHSINEFENALKSAHGKPDQVMATVQVVEPISTSMPEPVMRDVQSVDSPLETTWEPDRVPSQTKKPFWKQPWLYLGLLVVIALCIGGAYGAFQLFKPEEESTVETVVVTATEDLEATNVSGTRIAQTHESEENTNAELTSQAQTEAVPMDTPSLEPPTSTPKPSPTLTPLDTFIPTSTRTQVQANNTQTPTPGIQEFVIDSWCLSHDGCGRMKVNNATNSIATIRIWTKDGSINSTINYTVGISYFWIKPGTYNISLSYCGKYEEYLNHPLNQGWQIKLVCD